MKTVHLTILAIAMLASLSLSVRCQGVRIKDMATVQGVRQNQLLGYGLIIGLDGTGDSAQTQFTTQSVANMMASYGITIPTGKLKLKNVAAVMITASLPPFAREGSTLDVIVSSVGDCSSLKGGTLLQSPLKAANGEVYAVAQGEVSIGGFSSGSGGGGSVAKNHATVGRVPGGAIVEKETKTTLENLGSINITLNTNDFTTASRMAEEINKKFVARIASPTDANVVSVAVPSEFKNDIVSLIAQLEAVEVTTDSVAKVVVNERTGTVIIGGLVRLASVAISHGSLTVEINSQDTVSQPAPLSKGKTTVTSATNVKVTEEPSALVNIRGTATIEELTRALNALRVTPRDLIAILQALKQAGALQAQLEVI